MSRYSSKADLFDFIEGMSDDKLKYKTRIYVGDSKEPLRIDSRNDVIPYYPHVVCYANLSEKETSHIHISEKSYVDLQEQETLEWYRDMVLKELDNGNGFASLLGNSIYDTYLIEEIIKRVMRDGTDASLDGLHTKAAGYYRLSLVNEMLENGLDPADYGY